jgi:protein gp37
MDASVETTDYTFRIDQPQAIGARVRFLPLEPLLAPVRDLNLQGIDCVSAASPALADAR